VKFCDSSYLIAFVHPNPNPPMDRFGKPVTQFRERIAALIEQLSAANDVIGIPTPALAETLVRSGPNRAQYMKVLGDSWKFQLVPFDARAAIETAELIAAVKTRKEKWDAWAKVKFDIQIVAMAKAEGVSVIYSDDKDIENYAKRFNIRVIRICDLPLPPAETEDSTIGDNTPIGSQASLPLRDPEPRSAPNAEPDKENKPGPLQLTNASGPGDPTKPNDEAKADSIQPPSIPGSSGGHAQHKAAEAAPAAKAKG
jgi:predicted nucleic acid-binding protein